jgi:hypothetical protein
MAATGFENSQAREIAIYDMNGQLLESNQAAERQNINSLCSKWHLYH